MNYYLETLGAPQRHSVVQNALHSMTKIRTGQRIPSTEELEHGFPFYKNNLRLDLINYCNYLYEIDQFFDLDTDLLSNAANTGNEEVINVCEAFLNEISSINFVYSRNYEDFKRRLDVYIARHEKDSELEFHGLDSVMDSLNMLSCAFANVIEDCTKLSSAKPANCFGDNKELLNRCLVEAMDGIGSTVYDLFLIVDALESQDEETKQMSLFRLGARRGIYPIWPEKPLHGEAVLEALPSENMS